MFVIFLKTVETEDAKQHHFVINDKETNIFQRDIKEIDKEKYSIMKEELELIEKVGLKALIVLKISKEKLRNIKFKERKQMLNKIIYEMIDNKKLKCSEIEEKFKEINEKLFSKEEQELIKNKRIETILYGDKIDKNYNTYWLGTLIKTLYMIEIAKDLFENIETYKKYANDETHGKYAYISDYHGIYKEYIKALLSSGVIDIDNFMDLAKDLKNKKLREDLENKKNELFNEFKEGFYKQKILKTDIEYRKAILQIFDTFKDNKLIIFKNHYDFRDTKSFNDFLNLADKEKIKYLPIFDLKIKNNTNKVLVNLGDNIDKGINSESCFFTAYDLKKKDQEKNEKESHIINIYGNHECMYLCNDYRVILANAVQYPYFSILDNYYYNEPVNFFEAIKKILADKNSWEFCHYWEENDQKFFASHSFITAKSLKQIFEYKLNKENYFFIEQEKEYFLKKFFTDEEKEIINFKDLNNNLKEFLIYVLRKIQEENKNEKEINTLLIRKEIFKKILYELTFARIASKNNNLFFQYYTFQENKDKIVDIFPENFTLIIGHTYYEEVLKKLDKETIEKISIVLTDNNVFGKEEGIISYSIKNLPAILTIFIEDGKKIRLAMRNKTIIDNEEIESKLNEIKIKETNESKTEENKNMENIFFEPQNIKPTISNKEEQSKEQKEQEEQEEQKEQQEQEKEKKEKLIKKEEQEQNEEENESKHKKEGEVISLNKKDQDKSSKKYSDHPNIL